MRMLAILLALLVPAGQALAAMHVHCALEHPLGRVTPHAAGEAGHGHDHASLSDSHDRPDAPSGSTLFGEHHHHHHGGATSGHAGCCIGGSAGAMLCDVSLPGVDVRAESFDLPVPSGAYDSPFHEPPPRPQWRAYAPA